MSADVLAVLLRIEKKLDSALAARQQAERNAPQSTAAVAPDSDLDGQWGNPIVKFNPRDWTGDGQKSKYFSECPADFLDVLASTLDFFADKNAASDPKKAGYERKDAARARGWAKRQRQGWKPEKAEAGQRSYDFDDAGEGGGKDALPF